MKLLFITGIDFSTLKRKNLKEKMSRNSFKNIVLLTARCVFRNYVKPYSVFGLVSIFYWNDVDTRSSNRGLCSVFLSRGDPH